MTMKTIGAALVSAALVASLAGTAVTAEAAPTTSKAAAPIAVTIGASHVVSMPTTIQPGVNEFRVTTEAKQSGFQLAQFAEGYTLDEAIDDIEKGLEQGKMKAFKRFEANVTLLGGAFLTDGQTKKVTLNLPAGTYYATDIAKNRAGAFTQFTVAGVDTGAVMPSGSTVRAVKDRKWAKNPKAIARRGMLTFENFSSKNHFVELTKLKKGKSVADYKAWIDGLLSGEEGPPPVTAVSYASGVVSPGKTVAMNYKLPAGKYVLACFWPDADMEGMPHAFMGMYRSIKLR